MQNKVSSCMWHLSLLVVMSLGKPVRRPRLYGILKNKQCSRSDIRLKYRIPIFIRYLVVVQFKLLLTLTWRRKCTYVVGRDTMQIVSCRFAWRTADFEQRRYSAHILSSTNPRLNYLTSHTHTEGRETF